jgi:tRNA nucleotidyltransferase (CCA-adding enzyme)
MKKKQGENDMRRFSSYGPVDTELCVKKKKLIRPETIITSHVNADFDAVASMLAAQKLYPDASIILPGSQEKSLRDFFIHSMSYLFNMADVSRIDFSDTKRIVLVDTRQRSRVPQIAFLLDRDDIDIHIYDHHPSMEGDLSGSFEIIRSTGASVTILCSLLREKNIALTPDEATIMAIGIYEDTGSFTYSSTTPEDLMQAAFLLDCGVSLNTVVNFVVKEIKSEQVTWLNELLNEMKVYNINGVNIYLSVISSPSYITDMAVIVQKVVRMEKLDIFFAIVLMNNKITIIARNRLSEVDVGKILADFGGGGHAYAASAKVEDYTLAQLEFMLIQKLEKEVTRVKVAKNLMASPAIMVEPSLTCREAGKLMTRYNINTLLVADTNKNIYEGYITRQVIEKILYHQLSHLPVKEYMNSEAGFVSSDADISQIEQMIIEEKQKIIPVIDKGVIKGVITRTNILNYLVQHNKDITEILTESEIQKKLKIRRINHLLYQRLDNHILTLLTNIGQTGQYLGWNTFAVGGFVRDLLLGHDNLDIDIVVEGDGIEFAKTFAKKESCRVNTYKKFATAVIVYPNNFKVDVASARMEYYQTPAALPIVEKSSIKHDLARRDFTINTLAISLHPDNFGRLIDFFGGMRDLKDKTIRTIHNLSFVEDPTRIFRAIKFANRFGFNIGKLTSSLIKNAVVINCFKNLSGSRVLSELKQIFAESDPIPAVKIMEDYGLEKILHKELNFVPQTYQLLESVNKIMVWHDLLYTNEDYLRWTIYFMAIFNRCSHQVSKEICERLNIPPKERAILMEKRYEAETQLAIIEKTPSSDKIENLYWKLTGFKTEFLLYMMALTTNEDTKKAISYFYTHLRHVKPIIRGKDLVSLGLKPGPVFSEILNKILTEKLGGKVKSKEAELEYVREYARENGLVNYECGKSFRSKKDMVIRNEN